MLIIMRSYSYTAKNESTHDYNRLKHAKSTFLQIFDVDAFHFSANVPSNDVPVSQFLS